jgi:hypothetical protein
LLFNRKALEDFHKLLNKSNSQNIAKVCYFKISQKTPKPGGFMQGGLVLFLQEASSCVEAPGDLRGHLLLAILATEANPLETLLHVTMLPHSFLSP